MTTDIREHIRARLVGEFGVQTDYMPTCMAILGASEIHKPESSSCHHVGCPPQVPQCAECESDWPCHTLRTFAAYLKVEVA